MKHVKNCFYIVCVVLATCLAAGLAAGCSPNNLPDYTVLSDLRVLALIADQPEVNPGTVVTFTPVVSDINGSGRTLNYTVGGCIDPGIGIGNTPTCTTPDPASVQSGTVTPVAGPSKTYTGAVTGFSVTMPVQGTVFAGRSTADQFNGVPYLIFYVLSVPGGPTVTTVKRVVISAVAKTPKNLNPVITSVDLNDNPAAASIATPLVHVNFRVSSPASSVENFQVQMPNGTFSPATETLVNTWFVSDAAFQYYRTVGNGENPWSPPTLPTTRGMVILVVTRDGRGGEAFQKIDLD